MNNDYANEDAVVAAYELAGRGGAIDFEIGYLRDDVPVEDAGWYAKARWNGRSLTAEHHRSPTAAANALAGKILHKAMCKCGRPVSVTDDITGCRWTLHGKRWEPGCDAPSIHVTAPRGDIDAIRAAGERILSQEIQKHKQQGQ